MKMKTTKTIEYVMYTSVSQPPGRGPVPGPRLVEKKEEFTALRSDKS
jgi:hypothetical protein